MERLNLAWPKSAVARHVRLEAGCRELPHLKSFSQLWLREARRLFSCDTSFHDNSLLKHVMFSLRGELCIGSATFLSYVLPLHAQSGS